MSSFFPRRLSSLMGGLLLFLGLCLLPAPEACAKKVFRQSGVASWYGAWHHGKTTANGEAFDMFAMTAAHKTLPLGSLVKVTRKDTGRSIIVRINDRGPYKKRRIIDLSYAAADSLGMRSKGVSRVSIEVVSDRNGRLLSDDHHFYVRLKDEEASPTAVSRQLGKLIHLGMHNATRLLHVRDGMMTIGPYKTFEESQAALIRVSTTHPGANIMLARKGRMVPAVHAMAQK
ncbi:MAG: septal ring lytic transglycosylase RlpA family protein [Mailhella sp.]|nr:septal ring lytic transglycosylase RlpA family protein [Mailhella sp.]